MLSALMTTALLAANPTSSLREQAAELRPLVRAVVACVLREPPDHADVEDCTSEAMRRALEERSEVRGPLRPWVLGIARHVALDTLRARQKQRARNVDVPPDAPSSTNLLMELFHMEGLSYQEIAGRLEVPLGTVATWVTRGRKAMAEALEDDAGAGGGRVSGVGGRP